jgi:hypothetical protein
MTHGTGDRDRTWRAVGASLFLGGLLIAMLTLIGADLLWLVAMGDHVRATAALPDGVPFAAASSEGWPPVLVLAELVLSVIHEAGLGGLLVWHYLLVLTALGLVSLGARRLGATDLPTALVVAALLLGGVGTFAVVRLQTFSLVPFALALLLVRSQHARPTRAMWGAPVLVAVWGNLHGSVLLGVCVIGAYLLCSRLRHRVAETLALGLSTLLALLLNPAGWRTPEYYLGVLQNQAAAQKEGLWAAPDLTNPFDVLMVTAAVLFGGFALRRRLAIWEYVALAGLTVVTVVAARNGIWLLLFLAGPAARGLTRATLLPRPLGRPAARPLMALAVGLAGCGGLLAHRSDAVTQADAELAAAVREAVRAACAGSRARVESLAVHGCGLVANPLDAFSSQDQRAISTSCRVDRYGEGRRRQRRSAVKSGTAAADGMADFPGFGRRRCRTLGAVRPHVTALSVLAVTVGT